MISPPASQPKKAQIQIIKMEVCGGGPRASVRGPARRFSFLFNMIILLSSFVLELEFFSRMYCDANSAQAEEPSCHVFHRRFSQQSQVSYWEMSEKIITSARFEDKSFTRSSFFSKMQSVVATTVIEHEPNVKTKIQIIKMAVCGQRTSSQNSCTNFRRR